MTEIGAPSRRYRLFLFSVGSRARVVVRSCSLSRQVLLSLVALALLLGAAVPRGWMPARAADGSIEITICPEGLSPAEHEAFRAHAQMKMDVALGKKKDHKPSERDAGQCAYAMAAHAATLGSTPTAGHSSAVTANPVNGLSVETSVGQGLAAPPPPARGPPTIS